MRGKTCSECGEHRSADVNFYGTVCSRCHFEIKRGERVPREKSKPIPDTLVGHKCFLCGKSYPEVEFNRRAFTSGGGWATGCNTCADAQRAEIGFKHCSGCDQTLPASDFDMNWSKPDYLQIKCQECMGPLNKEWAEQQ